MGKGKLRSPVSETIYANVIWPGMKWKIAAGRAAASGFRPRPQLLPTNAQLPTPCECDLERPKSEWSLVTRAGEACNLGVNRVITSCTIASRGLSTIAEFLHFAF